MNIKTPTFRRHASGIWFTKWGGKNHYFTRDQSESFDLYLKSLELWAKWRRERQDQRATIQATLDAPAMTVHELAERFFASRLAEGGPDRLAHYQKHLKRFLAAYSTAQAASVRPVMLQRLKDVMLASDYKPRTINHDIQSIKTLFQFGMDLELIPPVNLRGVKKLPLGEIKDKSWPVGQVRKFILGATDPNMRAWLAMQYLCGMRPKEVVRVMTGQGEWVQRGIMVIPNKSIRSRIPRHVLFSAEAFAWWRLARPQWTRLDSYSSAVRKARKDGPHRLRHSAGTHLMSKLVHRDDADAILGHYPRAVSVTYMRMQWRRLRYLSARLTLKDSTVQP